MTMSTSANIKTFETDPSSPVLGRCYKAHDGHVYFCDSLDPRLGFWMTRVDTPPERRADEDGEYRRNVSGAAIGRTFHEVYRLAEDTYSCQYGHVPTAELGEYAGKHYYERF
jgi:hypothetical protein